MYIFEKKFATLKTPLFWVFLSIKDKIINTYQSHSQVWHECLFASDKMTNKYMRSFRFIPLKLYKNAEHKCYLYQIFGPNMLKFTVTYINDFIILNWIILSPILLISSFLLLISLVA